MVLVFIFNLIVVLYLDFKSINFANFTSCPDFSLHSFRLSK